MFDIFEITGALCFHFRIEFIIIFFSKINTLIFFCDPILDIGINYNHHYSLNSFYPADADRDRYANSQFDVNVEEYCRETLEPSQVMCVMMINLNFAILVNICHFCVVQVCKVQTWPQATQ